VFSVDFHSTLALSSVAYAERVNSWICGSMSPFVWSYDHLLLNAWLKCDAL